MKKTMIEKESPFEAIFGTHPYTKIVDILITHPDCEYTLSELAESAEVQLSWVTLIKNALLQYKIMEPIVREEEQRYKFDKKSLVGTKLNSLSFSLADTGFRDKGQR